MASAGIGSDERRGRTTVSLRVGIVDSGIAGAASQYVVGRMRDTGIHHAHGTAVAEALLGHSQRVSILDAQVFYDSLSCTTSALCDALGWLRAQGAQVINISLGLRRDDETLRAHCAALVSDGVVLVASAPARGDPVYPAAYPGVLSATGDARCAARQISYLGTRQADFGGCPNHGGIAGASIGSANVCGALCALLNSDTVAAATPLHQRLRARADFEGPEQRR